MGRLTKLIAGVETGEVVTPDADVDIERVRSCSPGKRIIPRGPMV